MQWLARLWFRLKGWQYAGTRPRPRKFVAIAGPHTSNWDFIFFLAVASHFEMKAKVIGKDTLVRGPFGGLMRRLGVIPVRRDTGQGLVEQMVDAFNAADDMALVVAPEGTRRAEPYWRSGFYHIALAAEVPIVMAKIDANTKVATVSEEFYPTGDVRADMDHVRDFFRDAAGVNAGGESTVRLRDEDPDTAAD